MQEIPIIDISPLVAGDAEGTRKVAASLGQACEEIGFFCVTGHAVPIAMMEAMQKTSRDFFAQSVPDKCRVARRSKLVERGYTGFGEENLAYTRDVKAPPDLKEHYSAGPLAVPPGLDPNDILGMANFAENLWPEEPASFEPTWSVYYHQQVALTRQLLQLMAMALDLSPDYFVKLFDKQPSVLRSNFYPFTGTTALPGQMRAGAHSDYGMMTILLTDRSIGGLQVQTRAGNWIDVVSPPGGYVVNLGDMAMMWTNDRWISTLHRVVPPPPEIGSAEGRLSVAFFCNPNYDAVISCIPTCLAPGETAKHPTVVSGAHRRAKIMMSRRETA